MNFTNLLYFLTVADELSLSKAAQKLYISQQSLSGHISRLEKEFGVPLFERYPKMKLTYAGVCTEKLARQILALNQQMHTQIEDIANERKGQLRIGIATRVCGRIVLPQVLPQYHNLYPDVELHLDTGLTGNLINKLQDGNLDIIIGVDGSEWANVSSFELYQERFCVIVPHTVMRNLFPVNTIAVTRAFEENGADISAFKNAPFLMMAPGKRVRTIADKLFIKAGFSPNIILQSADLDTLFPLCTSGLGIMFSFEESIKKNYLIEHNSQNKAAPTHVFPIGDKSTWGHTRVYISSQQYHSKAVQNFITLMLQTFHINDPDAYFFPIKEVN